MFAKYLLILIIILSLGILYTYTYMTPVNYYSSYTSVNEPSLRDITSRDYSMIGEYSTKIDKPLYCWLLSITNALLAKLSFDETKSIIMNWYVTAVTDGSGIIKGTVDKALDHGESFNNWKVDSINLIDIQQIPSIIARNDYTNCQNLLDTVNAVLNDKGGDLIAGECTT